MKCNLSIYFLLITPLLLAFTSQPSHAQDKYFRYFVVETKALSGEDFAAISERVSRHEFMGLYSSCLEKKRLVIEVDAAYPKRIEDMKNEISSIVAATIKAKNILSVMDIPLAERNQNCP